MLIAGPARPGAASGTGARGAPGRRASEAVQVAAQPGHELRGHIRAVAGELDLGAQVVELVAGVVASAAEQHAVHPAPVALRTLAMDDRSASVSWISPPRPGGVSRSTSKIAGSQT